MLLCWYLCLRQERHLCPQACTSNVHAPPPKRPSVCLMRADRQALGKITSEGLFLEELERQPGKYLPEVTEDKLSSEVVKVRCGVWGGSRGGPWVGRGAACGWQRGLWDVRLLVCILHFPGPQLTAHEAGLRWLAPRGCDCPLSFPLQRVPTWPPAPRQPPRCRSA